MVRGIIPFELGTVIVDPCHLRISRENGVWHVFTILSSLNPDFRSQLTIGFLWIFYVHFTLSLCDGSTRVRIHSVPVPLSLLFLKIYTLKRGKGHARAGRSDRWKIPNASLPKVESQNQRRFKKGSTPHMAAEADESKSRGRRVFYAKIEKILF